MVSRSSACAGPMPTPEHGMASERTPPPGSWALLMAASSATASSATTERAKQYIDFAAKNGFRGVLIEGWNVGWDGNWFGNGNAMNFSQPTEDFDADALAAAVQMRRREAAHLRTERAPQQFGHAALALRAHHRNDARSLSERRLERGALERVAFYGSLLDRYC